MNWRNEKELLRKKYKQEKSVKLKDLRQINEKTKKSYEDFKVWQEIKSMVKWLK